MKKFKKILCFGMMVMMIFAAFTACSSDKKTSTEPKAVPGNTSKTEPENTSKTEPENTSKTETTLESSDPNDAVLAFEEAINARSAEDLANVVSNKEMAESMDMTMDDIVEMCESVLAEYQEVYGENYVVKIEVLSENHIEGEELEEIKENAPVEIDGACELSAKMTIEFDGEEDVMEETLPVINYKGTWYILM